MNWLEILPESLKVQNLTLQECRNFKHFYNVLNREVRGPVGFQRFHKLLLLLLMYGIACVEDKKFPALNNCWNSLSPLFLTPEYDSEWFVHCWIFCDFPLDPKTDKVLLDYFVEDSLGQSDLNRETRQDLIQFQAIMKSSRLGLYQGILSTSKVTKYKELFTNRVISTVRSCPEYESGEIFVARIIYYLGDSFTIHDSRSYPPEYKTMLEDMVENKLFFISETKNLSDDYERFMKLAGPYWMSCTHPGDVQILDPDEYLRYY